ncbi:uncharacterized protein LOC130521102 [Takifugu flavidus]|nr:uncharacterized protein LOC130521102 [Takifugu flavidus]
MLKGLCLKHLDRLFQAELCFTRVLSSERQIRFDHYLVPFTLYELALLYHQQGTQPRPPPTSTTPRPTTKGTLWSPGCTSGSTRPSTASEDLLPGPPRISCRSPKDLLPGPPRISCRSPKNPAGTPKDLLPGPPRISCRTPKDLLPDPLTLSSTASEPTWPSLHSCCCRLKS